MIPVPEAVLPMDLDNRHEHRAHGSGCSQGCQEPKRQGETATYLPQDSQAGPEPCRFEPLFLHPLHRLGETRTSKPAPLLRSVYGKRQSSHQAKNEKTDTYCNCHESCSFQREPPFLESPGFSHGEEKMAVRRQCS